MYTCLYHYVFVLGQIPDEKPKWILLDGDLDANWIESMNSVMDDNKMLTLASNERIPLKPHMRMIFEIRNLRFATPATVSRAGILYISADRGFQWKALISSWLQQLEQRQEVKDWLRALFDTYIAETLLFFKIHMTAVVPQEDITMVTSVVRMLNQVLNAETYKDEETLHAYFVFCCVWAFGCALTVSDDGEDFKKKFSDWWRETWTKVKFPSRELVFDYWLDPETLKFEQWAKSPFFYTIDYDSKTPMSQVTVPTPETCSVTFWMKKLIESNIPVMLAGPAGTGKTQMVMGMLHSQCHDPTQWQSTTINFNFYTNSIALQATLELPLEKKTGTNFAPPGKARLIYFVDDLNLPEGVTLTLTLTLALTPHLHPSPSPPPSP
jgi:dynein heavy chain